MYENKLPKQAESLWLKQPASKYSELKESIETKVAIVGGGITGITAAYLLAKAGIQTVLIEADKIVHGTTGHTTAKISAQHGLIYNQLIEDLGIEKASLYYQANAEAMNLIAVLIKEHKINCNYEKQDAYVYTNDMDKLDQLDAEYKAYETLGIKGELLAQMPLDIPHKAAIKMPNQAQFHPVKYVQALAVEAAKKGAQLFENTPAVDIEYGSKPNIILRNGLKITCEHAIIASHYPFWDKNGLFFAKMEPQRSYVNAIKSPLKYPGGMYINAEQPTRSIRKMDTDQGELWLIGGDSHKTGQGETEIKHVEALQNFADQHFQAEETSYRWSAQDPVTLDHVPYIGQVTDSKKNIWIATGYAKWGMTQGTIAAKHLCNSILGKDSPYGKLYNPSRFEGKETIKNTVTYNMDTAKHLVKSKLDLQNEDIDHLETDQAAVTRINGQRTGAYKDEHDKLFLVDTTCTHLGCEVNWNSGERSWDCPCHGSRFSYTGEVLEGPATRPLKRIDSINHNDRN